MRSFASLCQGAGRYLERVAAAAMHRYARISYSQEGEDMILRRLFETQTRGFYVDVGAHHPQRYSNTYHFYRNGWSGINIDAAPGSMEPFKRVRPRDINLEAAVDREEHDIPYFVFNDEALNTFDAKLAETRNRPPYRIVKTMTLRTRRLENILDENLPAERVIDFMGIDVEGFDLNVLESNDWSRYRPRFIVVESLDIRLSRASENPIVRFLSERDYELAAKSLNSLIFNSRIG